MEKLRRVIVTPSALKSPSTTGMINRIGILYPQVQIEYSSEEESKIKSPKDLDNPGKITYMKETLVLTTRKGTPFVTTFASPGKIVENLGNILCLGWHCLSQCEFCYLLGSAFQVSNQMLYTNLDRLSGELSSEVYMNRAVLSLWSALSFYQEIEFKKIPEGFQKASNYLRGRMLKNGVNSEKEALKCLKDSLPRIFKRYLQVGIEEERLEKIKEMLPEYYRQNSQFPSWLNVSEYTDIIATDPISNNMDFLMRLVQKNPELHISLRTKSANFQNMLNYDGHGRVKVTMNFNTEHVIGKYELGTAGLFERIRAAKQIQDKGGYLLKIAIEPIISYPGYEEDYRGLSERLMKELDTEKIVDISLGTVRYKGKLKSIITSLNPETNLFSESQGLVAIKNDRIRYREDEREKIYKVLIKVFSNHTQAPLRLAAETPELWDMVGLKSSEHISKSVYQFQNNIIKE